MLASASRPTDGVDQTSAEQAVSALVRNFFVDEPKDETASERSRRTQMPLRLTRATACGISAQNRVCYRVNTSVNRRLGAGVSFL
jgi:hypothetical protein